MKQEFSVVTHTGSLGFWEAHQSSLLGIQESALSDLIQKSPKLRTYYTYLLREEFADKATTIHLLQTKSAVVGFTSWYQAKKDNPFSEEEKKSPFIGRAYDQIHRQSVQVGWTAIHEDFQHQGGWSLLMNVLDAHIAQAGYTHMVRYVRTAGHYPEKIEARYPGSILFKAALAQNEFGEQVYLRMKIPRE